MPYLILVVVAILLAACTTPLPQEHRAAPSVTLQSATSPPDEAPASVNRQNQLQRLLQAEFLVRERRFDEAFPLLLALAEETTDPHLSARAFAVAEQNRNNMQMQRAIALWLQQHPDDRTALMAHARQLLAQYRPLAALSVYERLDQLGETVNFLHIPNAIISPTRAELHALLTRFTALSTHQGARRDVLLTRLLLHQKLAQIALFHRDYVATEHHLDAIFAMTTVHDALTEEVWENLYLLRLRSSVGAKRNTLPHWIESILDQNIDFTDLYSQYLNVVHDRAGIIQADINAWERANRYIAAGRETVLFNLWRQAQSLKLPQTIAIIDDYYEQRMWEQDALALLRLGMFSEAAGDVTAADEFYARIAVDSDFRHAALERRLGLWAEQGEWGIVRQLHKVAAAEWRLSSQEALLLLAQLFSDQARYSAAIDAFTIFLRDHPDNTAILFARATAYLEIQQYALMEADLRQLIARNPNHAHAYNALGYVLADMDMRLDEALRLIQRALMLDGEHAAFIDSLGWVYYRLGDFQRARTLFEIAYRAFPDAEITAHLGEVYWMLGARERAIYLLYQGYLNNRDDTVLNATLVRLGLDFSTTGIDQLLEDFPFAAQHTGMPIH